MRLKMRVAAVAAAMGSVMPALAQSFPDCTYDCRTAYEAAIGQCARARTVELAQQCRTRADQTRIRCMNTCTRRENQRLELLRARQQEAAERARLRAPR
jgi:hypothetical protein